MNMGLLDFFSKKDLKGQDKPAPDTNVIEYEENYFDENKLESFQEVYVKPMTMRGLQNIQEIVQELKHGNIVIVNIAQLINNNPAEAKRAIDQLKGTCKGLGGDLAGIGEDRLLITPSFVKIWRGDSGF